MLLFCNVVFKSFRVKLVLFVLRYKYSRDTFSGELFFGLFVETIIDVNRGTAANTKQTHFLSLNVL